MKVRPFLMFEGKAEEAMTFYTSLFPDSKILDIRRYGPGEAGAEGSIHQASFQIGEQIIACIDSPVKHGFSFTPSFSLFVDCDSESSPLCYRARRWRDHPDAARKLWLQPPICVAYGSFRSFVAAQSSLTRTVVRCGAPRLVRRRRLTPLICSFWSHSVTCSGERVRH